MSNNMENKQIRKRKSVWTEDEIFFLKESYADYTKDIAYIANILGLNKASVARKAKQLGLVKINCSNAEIPEGYKICRDCKEIKPVEDFWKNSTKTTKAQKGRDTYCIICAKDRLAKKRLQKLQDLQKQKEQDVKEYIEKYKNDKFVCTNCKKVKSITDFSVHCRKSGGANSLNYTVSRSSICKTCHAIRAKEYSIKKLQEKGHI